ncbi:NADPH2:quinone reductase [Aliiroseovarius halocynthiae]|uniref:NADPH:quinone oxidoreductase family protein n=1 Tax=Aliiroseovarius halocynthiae TaxID=985055 RepID=A0A545STW1_9RHOB|nr:NADPH:quinone oxidoreductase family protein [Aliiroseovarius halocynthiae]TQV68396.1 NADPH:quinone oxidoreductase family protein [Aliiroseovarius halocynthiae]SMR70788.1 NADPH2:quinone reductase [Aliiroseovarius halocynthiae]
MKTFRVSELGKQPTLTALSALPLQPGHARVDIRACGLNFADLLMTKGRYQDTPETPFSLGMEPAGIVTELGPETGGLAVGTRVVVFSGKDGLADEGVFPADRCLPLPDNMSFEDAAAFQITYGTSHMALDYKARLQPGETLLVLGAAGGVGLTAVEIGKVMGARVIACARGADKLEICKKAGADHMIDSTSEDIREVVKALGGADVVYDAVGGEQGEAAFRATNPDGRFLYIGFASGDMPNLKPNHMLVKNITTIGFYWGGYLKFNADVLTDSLRQLLTWYAEGKIHPHVSHTLPLEQAEDALELLRSRKSTGKVVVTMGPNS